MTEIVGALVTAMMEFGVTVSICLKDSAGVLHLKKLSSAGITHVHLLPTFQFAGVDDQKEDWRFVGKIYDRLSSEQTLVSQLNLLSAPFHAYFMEPLLEWAILVSSL